MPPSHVIHRTPGQETTQFTGNRKLSNSSKHPAHVTTLSDPTCQALVPQRGSSCEMYKACYAKGGRMGLKTNRVNGTVDDDAPVALVALAMEEARGILMLPPVGLLRIHDYGEMPDPDGVRIIARAALAWRARCHSAYPDNPKHGRIIWFTHAELPLETYEGCPIMRSVHTHEQAERARAAGFAIGAVTPPLDSRKVQVIQGQRLLPCVYQASGGAVDCYTCGACSQPEFLKERGIDGVAFQLEGRSKKWAIQHVLAPIEEAA